LHSKIQQFLASNDLSSPTPNAILKLLTEQRTVTKLFPSLMWLLRMLSFYQF